MNTCKVGLNNTIESILNNKPWFKFDKLMGTIYILDSPNKKINSYTSIGVANSLAAQINKAINDIVENVGDIVYPRIHNDRGIVIVNPTNIQLSILNAKQDEVNRLKELRQLEQEDLQRRSEGNWTINQEGDVVPFFGKNALFSLLDAVDSNDPELIAAVDKYATYYIDMFENSPLVKQGISLFGSKEELSLSVAKGIIEQKGEALSWWTKFKEWLLKTIRNISVLDKERVSKILTDAVLQKIDLYQYTDRMGQPTKETEQIDYTPYEIESGIYTTKQQTEAINTILNKLEDSTFKWGTLQGHAGTGKTTIAKVIIKKLKEQDPKAKFVFLGPTHESASVLASKTDEDVSTVASALAKRKDINSPTGEFYVDEDKLKASFITANYIIVDEGSMVSDEDIDLISKFSRAKVLYLADKYQHKPPGQEGKSKVFSNILYELTDVVRYEKNNPITEIISLAIKSADSNKRIDMWKDARGKYDVNKNVGLLFYHTPKDMIEEYKKDIQKDPLDTIVITYNNETHPSKQSVKSLNPVFRKAYFESIGVELNPNEPYIKGELLISYSNNQAKKIQNAERFIVESSTPFDNKTLSITHPSTGKKYTVSDLSGHTVLMKRLSDDSMENINIYDASSLAAIYNKARVLRSERNYIAANLLTDSIISMQYGYVMTSHKAQGKSIKNTYVIESNMSSLEALYTSATRTTTKLVVFNNIYERENDLSYTHISENRTTYVPTKEIKPKDISKAIEREVEKQSNTRNIPLLNTESKYLAKGAYISYKNNTGIIADIQNNIATVKMYNTAGVIKVSLLDTIEVLGNYPVVEENNNTFVVTDTDIIGKKGKSSYSTKDNGTVQTANRIREAAHIIRSNEAKNMYYKYPEISLNMYLRSELLFQDVETNYTPELKEALKKRNLSNDMVDIILNGAIDTLLISPGRIQQIQKYRKIRLKSGSDYFLADVTDISSLLDDNIRFSDSLGYASEKTGLTEDYILSLINSDKNLGSQYFLVSINNIEEIDFDINNLKQDSIC